jgi:spermidine synthase
MRAGVMIGSFISVLALFSLPVTLLGTASPFAIRLAIQEKEQSGTTAGRIYAISTLGSFIGTFLPVLLLIPMMGTYRTFLALSGMLMFIALFGLAKTVSLRMAARLTWMPFVLLASAFFGLRGLDKSAKNIVFEAETAYNYIQVQETNGYRILRLNEGQGIHSIYHPTRENFNGPWEQILSAPFFNPPPVTRNQIQRLAILGLAAGTSANQAATVFPNVIIDGYEIDPGIIQVGYDFFNMNTTHMQVFAEDARWGITHNDNLYDIISIDAYKPPYIPWHLTTQEFFAVIYERLDSDGTLVMNVARIFNDRRLVNGLYTTVASVFPSVYIIDLPNSFNSIIFASKQVTATDNLILNYIALSEDSHTPQLLLSALEVAILNIQPDPQGDRVYTDDHAPIEWITNAMIFDLFRSGQIEEIQ